MAHHHHHGHSHHGHSHDHHDADKTPASTSWLARNFRLLIAAGIVLVLAMSACLVTVEPGTVVVVTRVGNPVRVLAKPGLALKWPAPIENTIDVDVRLRTTSSGLQDVGTRDGLRVIVQAYVAWQVPDDPEHVRQFLRAVQNQPDLAANQLRSFVGSSLEITASSFDLASLVNTDASQVRLDKFEENLRRRIDAQALSVYGITIRQVGIERLTLPAETLDATIERMKAERDTVAAQRVAEGQREASAIRSDAERDSRIVVAKAKADAADIEANARVQAATIYKQAYALDPKLYSMLRSFDTLDAVLSGNTRLILRTDAAPFRVLVDGPDAGAAGTDKSRARQ
jgi:membrane protease subunit HflC